MTQAHAARESEVRPVRMRGEDLRDKLEIVRTQLVSTRSMRERSMSTTSLDMRDKTKLDMSMIRDVISPPTPGSAPVLDMVGDPPPYKESF